MTEREGLALTSSHWGTYRARVSNGRVQELLPFEHDKDPSPIGPGILDVQHGPTRVDAPMVRKSWLEGGPGPSAHSCLIEVEPFPEPAPPVTAHEPPEIFRSGASQSPKVQT